MVTEIQALADRTARRFAAAGGTELDAGRVAMLLAVLTPARGGSMADRRSTPRPWAASPPAEPAADLAIALALASAVARRRAAADGLRDRRGVALRRRPPRAGGLDRRLAEAARLGLTTALVPAGHRGAA